VTGGQEPERKRAGGYKRWNLGAGSGVPKVGGSGRNRGNCTTLHNILQWKKPKETGANKHRVGTAIKGYGKQEV